MRIRRRNGVLAALLGLLVAANLVVGGSRPRAAVAAPLLPGFAPSLAAHVRIEDGDAELDLRLGPDGWTVEQRRGFRAHGGAVHELLARLGGLSTADRVADEAGSHERYGVASGSGSSRAPRLTVRDAEGAVLADLVVGRPAEETAAGSYVRPVSADAVYRAPRLEPLEADPARWLDTRLVDFDPAEVTSLHASLAEPGLDLRLSRGDDGRWRVAGAARSLPPSEVDPLLLTAANLYFLDVVDATPREAGLEEPRFVLEVDGASRASVRLGGDGDGGRYASSGGWGTPWVVLLPESSARRLEAAVRRIGGRR